MKHPKRRDFIKQAVWLSGGGAVLSGTGLWPRPGWAAGVSFLEETCGQVGSKGKRVLVAYASMHGSTGEVAQAVGRECCARGGWADIRLVKKVDDLKGYDAVIVGSAIRSEAWLPEAVDFVRAHRKELKQMPVAFFLTCLTLSQPGEERLRRARAFLDPVLNEVQEVKPVGLGLFGGLLDYSRLSFGMRAVMKYKMWQRNVAEGDYRDWKAIRSWAGDAAGGLMGPETEKKEAAS